MAGLMPAIGAAALALVLTLGLTFAGVPLALGAHPFWAMKVGYIGIPAGLAVWLGLAGIGLRPLWLAVLSATVLALAAASAHLGKAQFAASYAEDALAGRFWFIGWIAVMGALAALIASLGALWGATRS